MDWSPPPPRCRNTRPVNLERRWSAATSQGVFHASGVLFDATIANQTMPGLRSVFAPKASSLERVQSRVSRRPTSCHVLFSSIASMLGGSGQAAYGAANAALDGVAAAWEQQGRRTTSVQWGAWAGGGMAAADASTAVRLGRMGMGLIAPTQGEAALEGLLRACAAPLHGCPPVVSGNVFVWERFLARWQPGVPAFFGAFSGLAAAADTGGEAPAPALAPAPRGAAAVAEQRAWIVECVNEAVKSIAGAAVPADEPLMAAGQ
jgi:KR domain